jgi:tRNA A37 N6-isopentenylltransferase MiaA
MSFNKKVTKKVARQLDLTEQETIRMAKRMTKFIKTKSNYNMDNFTYILLLKSFFILEDIKKKRYGNLASMLTFSKATNTVIKEHYREILNLHLINGWGSRKIAKYLQQKYKVKISHTTIYKFLKQYTKKQEI